MISRSCGSCARRSSSALRPRATVEADGLAGVVQVEENSPSSLRPSIPQRELALAHAMRAAAGGDTSARMAKKASWEAVGASAESALSPRAASAR